MSAARCWIAITWKTSHLRWWVLEASERAASSGCFLTRKTIP